MGRVRGKAKKLTAVGSNSTNVEQVPPYRKRGRPQKLIKEEELDDEEITKINEEEEEDAGDSKLNPPTKDINGSNENGKRKRSQSLVKGNVNSDAKINSTKEELSKKKNGYRHIGSRRKSKPRRAAEAGFPVQLIDS